jgi:ABC-type Fe3+/spermidine/putrescine transport system ATPase subunit
MTEEPLLRIEDVHKAYVVDQPVLADIDLVVMKGEIVCLLGPSGCGKTTLLRIVAGLETADFGCIHYAGQDLANVPVHAREFGFMFQDFALFPHKNVGENVAFGLRMEQRSRGEIEARVHEMLALVSLDGYAQRSVYELSGGERQRVALARSLAPSPGLLMLDEPLGALDRSLREELMIELREILKGLGVTALYVTHDQQEAFAVADRIVVMNAGRIEQEAPPQMVHDQPASPFVARFLGFQNLLPARLEAGPPALVVTQIGRVRLAEIGAHGATDGEIKYLLIRPEAARFIDEHASGGDMITIDATLESNSYRGSYYRIAARPAAEETMLLSFDVPAYRLLDNGRRRPIDPATLTPGLPVTLALDPSLMTLLSHR